MNHHIDEILNDHELAEALDAEAADPTDEHIEQLRQQVALHTKPVVPIDKTIARVGSPGAARWRRFYVRMSLGGIAAVVLAALLLARPFIEDAAAGLQNTFKATRQALWIHGSTTIQHADKTIVAESWCSPAERIVAFRSPQMLHFVDYELGLQSSYTARHQNVFQWNADSSTEGFGRQFVHALLNDQDLQSSFPLHDVSDVKKTIVKVDGKSFTRYFFHVQMKVNPEMRWETTIQTDPETGRIFLWEDRHANEMHVTVEFDYPDDGPQNIFELGAPSTAEIVKIATPASDLFGN